MSDPYTGNPPLTAEQQAVVGQPADARVLVIAGAGAGKTHTLVRRLDFLVAEEGVSAGEILVLTFSRAAVRELRDRLAEHGEAARHVRAQTFDSWALDLLMQVDAQGNWPERSFEERIVGARRAIEDGLAEELYGEDLLHVVIDEVQDLVGDRREPVEALLGRFDCGFTVVGDPAQSIYGFTVPDAERRAGEANRFFVRLRDMFGEGLIELHLSGNFRADTEEARTALSYGPLLCRMTETGADDGARLYEDLRAELHGRLDLGELDAYVCESLKGYDGTTAILCRTNGQALSISERLAAHGVAHRLQRSAQERVAPSWLGLLFRAAEGTVLSRGRFDELVSFLPLPEDTVPDRLWRSLLRAGGGRGGDRSIDLGMLRTALATGRLPDELTAQPPAGLVVSSFHRVKGLEFDRVVIADPGPLQEAFKGKGRSGKAQDTDPAEEARLLYVAMTRPRRDLFWIDAPASRFIRIAQEIPRWGRYAVERWARRGLEILGGDVHTDQPAGMHCFDADAVELQEYLATKVLPGDEVVLDRLHPVAIEFGQSPPYLIMHGGRPIGIVSERFRSHLYRFMGGRPGFEPRTWPRRITGVRIDAVETVAGSRAVGEQARLGPHGVWLAPRLVGLSRFVYEKQEDADVPAR